MNRKTEYDSTIHPVILRRSALAAAITLSLAGNVHALSIDVSPPCTLVDVIKAANSGAMSGSCNTGSGAPDKLVLTEWL